jgi:hypothetical protein
VDEDVDDEHGCGGREMASRDTITRSRSRVYSIRGEAVIPW